jgi:hypothetical protein
MTATPSLASTSTYRVDSHYCTIVYLSAIPLVLLFGLVIPVIGLVAAFRSPAAVDADIVVLIGLPLLAMLASLWGIRRWADETWLAVSQNGLTYHTPGLTIHTGWENIERIDDRFGKVHCILRHRSATAMSPWTTFWRWTSSANWNIDRRIPLHIFPYSGRSPLRLELEQFIPQLTARP